MTTIIPQSRLAEMLATAAGIPLSDATSFVREYFVAAEALLAKGQDVTIPEVGTFKLTGLADQPVVFVVDGMLAEAVNAPFEGFVPVEVPESVPVDNLPKVVATPPDPLVEVEIETDTEPEPEIETEPETIAHVPSEPETEREIEPEIEPESAQQPEAGEPATVSVPPVIEQPPVVEQPPVFEQQQAPPTLQQPVYYTEDYEPKGVSRGKVWLFVILALIVGLGGGFTLGLFTTAFFSYDEVVEDVSSDDSEYVDDDDEVTDEVSVAIVEDTAVAEDSVVAEVIPPAVGQKHEPRYDSVTNTKFLTNLARKYYDGKWYYWVYIYDANNLDNPNRISPGTRVRIPYEDEIALTGNHQRDSLNALARAREIEQAYSHK